MEIENMAGHLYAKQLLKYGKILEGLRVQGRFHDCEKEGGG